MLERLDIPAEQIDWPKWFAWQIKGEQFTARREPFLQADDYADRFQKLADGLFMMTTDIPKYRDQPKVNGLMVSTRRRVWDVLNWVSLQYSAGPVQRDRPV